MYEAETLAPSTQMGQNVGTEVGHNILSSRATYIYPTKSKFMNAISICNYCLFKHDDLNFSEPDGFSYLGGGRKRKKKIGGKRHMIPQDRSHSSHINPNYVLSPLAFSVLFHAKKLFP